MAPFLAEGAEKIVVSKGNRLCVALSLMAVVLLCLRAGQPHLLVRAQDGTWSDPINLSNTPGGLSWYQGVATDQAGQVHVVWTEGQTPGTFAGSIYYTMYDGRSWSQPLRLSTPGETELAILAVLGIDSRGMIHVVWAHESGSVYRRAYAGGRSWLASAWSPPRFIEGTRAGMYHDMALDDGDGIHVVMFQVYFNEANRLGTNIHYSRSLDGGDTWDAPVQLSYTQIPYAVEKAQIAVYSDTVHVVWHVQDTDIGWDAGISAEYVRSLDKGETWSSPVALWEGWPTDWVNVAVDAAGKVLVNWAGAVDGVAGRYYQLSSDNGESWSAPMPMVRHGDGSVGGYGGPWVDMVLDSAGVGHAVLTENLQSGRVRLIHTWWDGTSWSVPVQITDPMACWPGKSKIAISEGNKIHLVWHGAFGDSYPGWEDHEIYYSTYQTSAPHIPPQPFTNYRVYLPLVARHQ